MILTFAQYSTAEDLAQETIFYKSDEVLFKAKGCNARMEYYFEHSYLVKETSLKNRRCKSNEYTENDGRIRSVVNCIPSDFSANQKEEWVLHGNYMTNSIIPYQLSSSNLFELGLYASKSEVSLLMNRIDEYSRTCNNATRINYADVNDIMNPLSDIKLMDKVKENKIIHDRVEQQRNAEWLKAKQEKALKTAIGFRKGLRVGDDSNCGMIIDIKPPIIKIQTQIGEKWIRLDQVYPPSTGCQFFNGVYQPPY